MIEERYTLVSDALSVQRLNVFAFSEPRLTVGQNKLAEVVREEVHKER